MITVIWLDQKDDGAVDNNEKIWKEMPVSVGKTGSLSHVNMEKNKWTIRVKLIMACSFDRWAAAESIVMLHQDVGGV